MHEHVCKHILGGAIYAGTTSVLLFYAPVSLLNNVAEDSGGAIYVRGMASLSMKDDVHLEGNKAGAYGGAT
jgi:predicted outer membrane repeat protein